MPLSSLFSEFGKTVLNSKSVDGPKFPTVTMSEVGFILRHLPNSIPQSPFSGKGT